MKKSLNKLLAFIASLCIYINVIGSPAFAANNPSISPSKYEVLQSNISAIEAEIESKGTTISEGLEEMILRFERQKKEASNEIEVEKIQRLIDTAKKLSDEYHNHKYKKTNTNDYTIQGIYDPAIAIVATYFSINGYYLSNELLLHAEDNTQLDSIYIPINKHRVVQDPIWQSIRNGSAQSGSGSFDTGDLYYAIHLFDWYKTSTHCVLSDRYDFHEDSYTDISGIAVNTMYMAQEAGELTPFYTTILDPIY